MKNKRSNAIVACLLALLLITVGMTGYLDAAVYAAAPNDENYDDDAGYSYIGTQFTLDGITYTLTGLGPDTLTDNTSPSGGAELGDGNLDYYLSVIGVDLVRIEAEDGSYFKLNGFEMGFFSGSNVTITPSTGSSITRASAGESYYSVDVSENSDFQYINYFIISGSDMQLSLDDLDFSPAVPPTHTVTYNGNGNTGGSAPTDGSSPYTEGDTVTVLGNSGTLVKTDYSFAGWNTAANGSGTDYAPAATFAMGSSDVTLYAKWAPLYTVTYNGNSNTGGAVPTDGNSYLSGDTVTVLDNTGTLVRTGYTFAGWNTAANGSGTSRAPAATFAMGGSNVTLYAQWTPIDYSVTYNGNTNTGGAVPTDATGYHITDTVTVLGNTGTLVKTGYTFAGWNTAANGSGDGYAPAATFAMGSSNVTLYAQWTENTYTVTYNGNSNTGGAVPTDGSSYYNGDTATVLGNTGTLVRTGYTFAGWNTAANGSGTGYVGGNTFSIGLSNVTLYAQWTPIDYTVTYNGNTNTGGAVPTDGNAYHITDTVTALGNTGTLVKTGYTFAGWNTAANGSGDSYAPSATFAMGSGNVTLYAQWTENTYSVTYNGNSNTGGAVPTDATSYHTTDTATVLGNTGTLVRTGYTFAGWNTAANGSGTSYIGGDTFAIGTSNVTLYAQWTVNDYGVTYNGNTNTGGAVPTDGNTYHITDTVTVLGNTGTLVKTGYTFAGWNTAANGSGTDYSGGNTFAMGGGNVTLYAQWTENVYSVTYNGNSNTGGAVPTDATSYHTTDTATVLGNTGTLVRTGYSFADWNTAANGSGTSYTGGDTFAIGSANVTLYAQWTNNDYTVTYNGNTNTGGSVPTDGSAYHITDTVTVLGNTGTLVKTGYVFTGWNTAANGSGTSYSGGGTFAMGGSNVTLYAQWSQTYTVTYDGNTNTGGAVPTDSGDYENGDTVTVLGNTGTLVKTGYTFAGWNTAANGSGTSRTPAATFAMGAGNVTLYAQWTENTYTITYDGNTSTSGSVPTDGTAYHDGDTVTVLGNTGTLAKTGYSFDGWNTAANGSGTDYSAADTFAIGANNVTLYAQWTNNDYTVTYNGNGSTGGTVPTDGSSYHITDTITVLGNTGTLVKTGYTFGGWNTAANGSGTTYAAGGTLTMGSANVTLYAKWNTSSSGGGGGGSTPPPVPPPNTSGADIIVNGETESAGTSTTTEVGGESVTTVVVDEVKIEQRLAQEGNGATVTIPINQNSDVVVGQLNGQMVKNMENREAVLEIRTAGVTYTLPAEQIDIDGISLQIGQTVALRDITVSIEVSTVTGQGVQFVQNIAEKGAFTIVAPPLEFNVRCTHGNQTINVNSFNAYVERTVAIPDGIDPAKVTTGVVIGTDGTIHHVPTRITIIDGRYYAQINSLTNSTYALIYNPIIFADVENHWSRNSVNNMASRMVIKGMDDTTFAPDRQTTRAEFATILIRGLGLTESKYTGMYTDIQGSDWYAGSIATANAYNIVKGYDDGTFRPNNTITREEAMAMIAAALKVAEKEMKLTKEEVNTLLQQFTDCCDVSDWAASPVSICVKRGIVAGDNQAIRPLDRITRAEMATMIQRMLQALKLI